MESNQKFERIKRKSGHCHCNFCGVKLLCSACNLKPRFSASQAIRVEKAYFAVDGLKLAVDLFDPHKEVLYLLFELGVFVLYEAAGTKQCRQIRKSSLEVVYLFLDNSSVVLEVRGDLHKVLDKFRPREGRETLAVVIEMISRVPKFLHNIIKP